MKSCIFVSNLFRGWSIPWTVNKRRPLFIYLETCMCWHLYSWLSCPTKFTIWSPPGVIMSTRRSQGQAKHFMLYLYIYIVQPTYRRKTSYWCWWILKTCQRSHQMVVRWRKSVWYPLTPAKQVSYYSKTSQTRRY